ncbi:MAG: protein translocase subunit SecD [Bradymonadia bacterium]
MDARSRVRAIVLLALVTVSGLMLVPTFVGSGDGQGEESLPEWYTKLFSKKMVLGLDLQGGILLNYSVQVETALERKTVQRAGNIEVDLEKERKIKVKAKPGKDGDLKIRIEFASEADTDKLDANFMAQFLPGYQVVETDGNAVIIDMTDDAVKEFQDSAIAQAKETIERRINAFGVAESSITKRGENQLVIQLPGVKEEDIKAAKSKLAQTGQLHFQIVDRTDAQGKFYGELQKRAPKSAEWPEELKTQGVRVDHKIATSGLSARSTSRAVLEFMAKGLVDDEHLIGFEQIYVNPKDPNLNQITNLSKEQEDAVSKLREEDVDFANESVVKAYELVYMFKKAGMSGENVEDAQVGFDQFNKPEVNMTFARVDADKFYEMTKAHTNELMAIMIDEMVFSAPNIKEPIGGGRVRIELGNSGSQALKEANALVAVLKSGALQAPLKKEYESAVGPSLGADSVEAGKLSMIIGFGLVVLFMFIYYRGAGFVADIALLLNVLFVLAGLTMFGATLTLPGIAGIVLTVGMAVDANVLIFERIREELRLGKSVRAAIDAGYEKAFTAILDANVTTGIAAVVLYQFGSGPVRGFAVTLGIGIICSMYTALVVTRLIFEKMYGGGNAQKMSI